jgi:hypothetical protein
MTSALHDPTERDDAELQFAGAAEHRIRRAFAGLAVAGEVVMLVLRQWPLAAGFALGAVVAFISMAHLQRVVQAFGARAAGESSGEPAAATVMRFLMRFALVTLAAYVVFKVSRIAAYGYISALFLPVTAMTSEAAYEAWFAIRNQRRSS